MNLYLYLFIGLLIPFAISFLYSYKNDHDEINFDNLLPHGNYDEGLNKDSYVRGGWKGAYTLCYAGTLEWVNAILIWIEENKSTGTSTIQEYLQTVKNPVLTDDEQRDLQV